MQPSVLYLKKEGKCEKQPEDQLKEEKLLAELLNTNLMTFFNLEMIASEFPLASGKLDTLAFDPESNNFVVIEYKKHSSDRVVAQVLDYRLLVEYNQDCLDKYNSVTSKNLTFDQISWEETRIMIISQSFSERLKRIANDKRHSDLELWEIQNYPGAVILEQISKPAGKKDLSSGPEGIDSQYVDMSKLFERYHDEIRRFDGVVVSLGSNSVSFKINPPLNFAKFYIRKDRIDVRIMMDDTVSDPGSLIHTKEEMKIGKIKGWLSIRDDSVFDQVMELIKHSYEISSKIDWKAVAARAVQTGKNQ